MDSRFRDLSRLVLISDLNIAQESMSHPLYIKDFFTYYFNRFISNLKYSFEDFSHSEIADFNKRNLQKIESFYTDSTPLKKGLIIPIPKGMIKSYQRTIEDILAVLDSIKASYIKEDFKNLLALIEKKDLKNLKQSFYSKGLFEIDKDKIAKLFGKTGLTHSISSRVFGSKEDVSAVNKTLMRTTQHLYPDIISLEPLLKTLEVRYTKSNFSNDEKVLLAHVLLEMAYRLSVFSVAMDHVQEIEHNFVKSLDILLQEG